MPLAGKNIKSFQAYAPVRSPVLSWCKPCVLFLFKIVFCKENAKVPILNGKMQLWTLLQHICPYFWAWLLNTIEITTKSEDKYVEKVFNSEELHFFEMTSFKIGTLDTWVDNDSKKCTFVRSGVLRLVPIMAMQDLKMSVNTKWLRPQILRQ